MKRILSLFLALVVFLSAFLLTSCGGFGGGDGTSAAPGDTTTADGGNSDPDSEDKRADAMDSAKLDTVLKSLFGLAGVTFSGTVKTSSEDSSSEGTETTEHTNTSEITFSGSWLLTLLNPKVSFQYKNENTYDYGNEEKGTDTENVYYYYADGTLYAYNDAVEGENAYMQGEKADLIGMLLSRAGEGMTVSDIGAMADKYVQEIVDALSAYKTQINTALTDLEMDFDADDLMAATGVIVNNYQKILSYVGYTSTVTVPPSTGSAAPILNDLFTLKDTNDGSQVVFSLGSYIDLIASLMEEIKTYANKPVSELVDNYVGAGTSTALTTLLDSVAGTDTVATLITRVETELTKQNIKLDDLYAVAVEILNLVGVYEEPTTVEAIKGMVSEMSAMTVDQLIAQVTKSGEMTYSSIGTMVKGYLAATPDAIIAQMGGTGADSATVAPDLSAIIDEYSAIVKALKDQFAFDLTIDCDSNLSIRSINLVVKTTNEDSHSDTYENYNPDNPEQPIVIEYSSSYSETTEINVTLTVSANVTVAPAAELQTQITANNQVK